MKNAWMQAVKTILVLTLLISVFYLREASQPERMEIPVTQVLSYAPQSTRTPTPLESFKAEREKVHEKDLAALMNLTESGDETAKEYLLNAIARHEKETAVEGALAASGYAGAVCAVREGAVTICISERVDAVQAQTIVEICEIITEECAENVFLLDECGYSW